MIHVQIPIEESTHRKLSSLAKDRGISLGRLGLALLEWGAEQDAATLHRLGIRVPIYPGEIVFENTDNVSESDTDENDF